VQRKGYGPLLPEVLHSHYAYCYRCPVNREPKTCRVECLDLLTQTMFGSTVDPREVAAVIVEPVQGEGGYVVPHPGFLKRLREITREHGILLIADEVQCGMGRTGRFFASQHFGLEPDLITVAKGIASGMPLGALIARADVMQWESGGHGSTFGGNPVSVAAALATLRLLEGGLVANAEAVGALLMGRLRDRLASHPAVGDIRGLGLMIGVEIVERGREPAPELRERILEEAFRRGLLLLGCGKSTIRLAPPLVIDGEDAEIAATILEESIRAVAGRG
jgi:4-aminobutyrate aminotransferase